MAGPVVSVSVMLVDETALADDSLIFFCGPSAEKKRFPGGICNHASESLVNAAARMLFEQTGILRPYTRPCVAMVRRDVRRNGRLDFTMRWSVVRSEVEATLCPDGDLVRWTGWVAAKNLPKFGPAAVPFSAVHTNAEWGWITVYWPYGGCSDIN